MFLPSIYSQTIRSFPIADNGCVISLTIVEMEVTKKRITAKESIANVPSQNSVAEMVNVFRVVGCVVSTFAAAFNYFSFSQFSIRLNK